MGNSVVMRLSSKPRALGSILRTTKTNINKRITGVNSRICKHFEMRGINMTSEHFLTNLIFRKIKGGRYYEAVLTQNTTSTRKSK